ncbi:hypothetical protein Taro_044904, partial [Colocasia esculenta]|nr:hypothetical protein [Colocasia esculenta]
MRVALRTNDALVVLVEVLPEPVVIGRLALLLTPCGLYQMVIWVVALAGAACPVFNVRRHQFSVVWLACASIVSVCVSACASAVLGEGVTDRLVSAAWSIEGSVAWFPTGVFSGSGRLGVLRACGLVDIQLCALCRLVCALRLFLLFSFLSSSLVLSEAGKLPPALSGGLGVMESSASSWRSGGASWSEEEAAEASSRQVGCRDTRQKVTSNLSLSGSDSEVSPTWHEVFPSVWGFALVAPFGVWDLGWFCPRALPSDEERDGSIRHVLNLKATPIMSLSCCGKIHVAFFLRVATGSSSPSGLGRYVTFRSEADTLVVATWWQHVGRHLLVQKATHRWLHSGCLVSGCGLCLGWPTVLLGDPQPRASVRGSSPGGGRAQVTDLEQKGKTALIRCRPASPSHCFALRWFRSHVGREVVGRSQWLTPDCCFGNPFLGAVHGGTGVCSSLTSWRVQGPGWLCLWALDLVELFLPDLLEVWDVGACVVRLGSHVVAPGFRRDSLSQKFIAGQSWWRLVRR